MKRLSLVGAILIQLTVAAQAYPEEYGPFEPSQAPKAYPLNECSASTNNEHGLKCIFIGDTNSSERVVIFQSENDGQSSMAVESKSGEKALGRIKIKDDLLYGAQVYWGLLNEDDKPDYVVQTWGGGCGLAAGFSDFYFLLSSGNSFHCSRITTLNPTPADFIDINQDGRPEFAHTSFVYGEKGKDGKKHNYWVYNLLQFKGDQVVSANQLDDRFPCWVWYTDKPNHKNTSQLAGKQKQRLWKNQASNLSLPQPH